MSTSVYTTEYMANATASRYFFTDRDVADEMMLPYNMQDIEIKPNELVLSHNINESINKLYDNMLYLVSQCFTPQSILPNKQTYTTFVTTSSHHAVSGLDLTRSYDHTEYQDLTALSKDSAWQYSENGVFFPHTIYNDLDCGAVFIDDGDKPELVFLRDIECEYLTTEDETDILVTPYTGDDDTEIGLRCGGMFVVSHTDRVDNYTNRKYVTAEVIDVPTALDLTGTSTPTWYASSYLPGAIHYPVNTNNFIFVLDNVLGTGWWYVVPREPGRAWMWGEDLGWIYVDKDFFPEAYMADDSIAGPAGWIRFETSTDPNYSTRIYNYTDSTWYDIKYGTNNTGTPQQSSNQTAPPEGSAVPTGYSPSFGAPKTKIAVSENTLYMLSAPLNIVYKYDISGLTQSDRAYFPNAKGKILQDIIGGEGDVRQDVRFNNIRTLCLDPSDNLYVVDVYDNVATVKKFDKNSNHVKTYEITETLNHHTPVDITFALDRFYILTTTHVHEYSSDFEHLKEWKLTDKLEGGEMYRTITPSYENERVVYIATNKNVFKKFTSKLDTGIGRFQFDGRGLNVNAAPDISHVSAVLRDGVEHVYVGDNAAGVIYKFVESSDYQRILSPSYENRLVQLKDIHIKRDEFVTNIVYNKSMARLFYNHSLIAHSIVGKFLCEYAGEVNRKFKTFLYLLPEYVRCRAFGTKPKMDNFIGINEPVLNSVINRTLQNIYDYQVAILKDLEVHVLDDAPPISMNTIRTYTPTEEEKYKPSE